MGRDGLSNQQFVTQVTAGASAADLIPADSINKYTSMIRIYNMHATAIAVLKVVDAAGEIGTSAEVTNANGIPIMPTIGTDPYILHANKAVLQKLRVIRQAATDVDLRIEQLDGVED